MADDLFSIERSHGKPRLTAPRPTDIGTVATDGERHRNQGPDGRALHGNQLAKNRGAKRAAKRHLLEARARVRSAVQDALSRGAAPEEAEQAVNASDRVLSDALAFYEAARSEAGSSLLFVIGPCAFFGAELAIGNYLLAEAAKAGLTTERGMLLHDRAMACEQAAARAMTAALAAAKALGGKKKGRSKLETILAAGEGVK